jgi:hypothetical protein
MRIVLCCYGVYLSRDQNIPSCQACDLKTSVEERNQLFQCRFRWDKTFNFKVSFLNCCFLELTCLCKPVFLSSRKNYISRGLRGLMKFKSDLCFAWFIDLPPHPRTIRMKSEIRHTSIEAALQRSKRFERKYLLL